MPFPESPTLQVGSRCHLRGHFSSFCTRVTILSSPGDKTMKVLVSYAHLIADFCYFFPSVGN